VLGANLLAMHELEASRLASEAVAR
jgi:hypothetical protein